MIASIKQQAPDGTCMKKQLAHRASNNYSPSSEVSRGVGDIDRNQVICGCCVLHVPVST